MEEGWKVGGNGGGRTGEGVEILKREMEEGWKIGEG
jgi:hypothetical protein